MNAAEPAVIALPSTRIGRAFDRNSKRECFFWGAMFAWAFALLFAEAVLWLTQ